MLCSAVTRVCLTSMASNSSSPVGGRTNFCLGRASLAMAVTGEKKQSADSSVLAVGGLSQDAALRLHKEGVWSASDYEEWACLAMSRPVAPFCDFKRYTKCCKIEVHVGAVSAAHTKVGSTTPFYKKSKHVVPKVQQVSCVGSDSSSSWHLRRSLSL